jgi:membrane-associated protease RseP (regulator of RpoE activity)
MNVEDSSGSPDSLVRNRFKVLDYLVVEDGSTEYKVEYEGGTKETFIQLSRALRASGFTARLYGTKQDATLLVSKEEGKKPTSRAPLILLSLTLISISITGLFLSSIFQQVSPRVPVIPMAVAFTLAVVGVLGLHEFAHRYVSKRDGKGSSVPYYIPNIPVFSGLPILSFLPTFGSVTFVRRPLLNRDALFDVYFIGPIVGMVVALAVSVVGAATSAVLTQAEYSRIFTSQSNIVAVKMNESLLQMMMKGFTTLVGLTPPVSGGAVYISSPIDIAAWVGFLVTFLNLLPAAVFDGGIMTKLVVSDRGSRIITALTGILLIAIDTPNYWVVVLLIFLLAARPALGETLDSVSDMAASKKILFLLSLVIMILCAPVPQNFATIALGPA